MPTPRETTAANEALYTREEEQDVYKRQGMRKRSLQGNDENIDSK